MSYLGSNLKLNYFLQVTKMISFFFFLYFYERLFLSKSLMLILVTALYVRKISNRKIHGNK